MDSKDTFEHIHITDEDLMRKLQGDNREVLDILFVRYQKRIFQFCFGLVGNRADAEDLTGDCFVTVFHHRAMFDPSQSFKNWIYTIARNRSFNWMRKRKRNILVSFLTRSHREESDSFDIPDTSQMPDLLAIKQEQIRHVRQAIRQLSFEQREAILLRQYHAMTYEEISRVLNCTLAKVKILIYRAREQLKLNLASILGEDVL